jgi:hypothetical protein
MWGSINKRILVQTGQGIKRELISKITNEKGLEKWLKR